MIGNFFECEADKNYKYYRVIQTIKEYSDGRRFGKIWKKPDIALFCFDDKLWV